LKKNISISNQNTVTSIKDGNKILNKSYILGVQLCFRRFPMALAVSGGRNK